MADEERTETGMDFAENDDLLSTDSHSIVRFSFDDTSSMVASIAEELRNSMTEMEEKGKEEEEGEGKGGEGKEGEEGEEGKEEKKVILFFNVPLHGHVNPTLDLVAALVKAGYRVIYYAEQKFKDLVCATNSEFVAYSSFCDVDFKAKRTDRNIYNTAKEMIEAAELIVDGCAEKLKQENIYGILFDVSAVWGKFLGEILNVPTVCCFPGLAPQWRFAFSSASVVSRFLTDRYHGSNHLRRSKEVKARLIQKYQLKDFSVTMLFTGSPWCNLVFTSREFQPYSANMDQANFLFLGPSLSIRQSVKTDFPIDLLEQNYGKVVYISMGTLYSQDPKFFNFCIETFKNTDYFVVMSVGRTTDIESLGEIPANFVVRGFVPQLEVLQRTSAFVSHGGMNGISESMFFNVPMILLPKTVEQELNANRMEKLGAGINLGPQEELTEKRLVRAVEQVIATPTYREMTQKIRHSFAQAGGVDAAVEAIEHLHEKKVGQGMMAALQETQQNVYDYFSNSAGRFGSAPGNLTGSPGEASLSDSPDSPSSSSSSPSSDGSIFGRSKNKK